MAKAKTPKTLTKAATSNAGKWSAAETAIDQIREKFGEGSIMKISDSLKLNVEAIPTGSISLDMALGVGGIPKGRIVEVYGPESSGKTTLTLHMIAEVQKRGGLAAFIDAEHALDPDYAKRIGVNLDDLLISQPDSGEQALDITETLVRSNALDLIVVDSVAALTPRAEIEGEMGQSHMGLQARLMSQALRKLTAIISKSHTTVIFINQIRMKIGVMFGNPETTTGGNALKFYASVRIEIRRSAQIKNGVQAVEIKVYPNGYSPNYIKVKSDQPVSLYLTTSDRLGCTSAFRIPSLGISRNLPPAFTDTSIAFTPNSTGRILFTCSMGMYSGVIEVI